MAVQPSDIPTGTVTASFWFADEDSIDANTDIEVTPVVSGSVFFTASVPLIRLPGKPATVIPLVFEGSFDALGNLVSKSDPNVGMKLPATDSALTNPTGFTWHVTFAIKDFSGQPVSIPEFDISVPTNGTVDLSTFVPVASTPGVITVQGAKGDPGGITLGTLLAASTDLNTVTTAGLYRIESAPTGANWPEAQSGILTVIQRSTSNYLMQEYTPMYATSTWNARVFYRRWNMNGTWSSWQTFNSTRIDQTAGRVIYQWDIINDREQRVYGDTGWRDVTSTVAAGVTAGGTIYVRRINDTVHLAFNGWYTASTGNIGTAVLPTGFLPVTNLYLAIIQGATRGVRSFFVGTTGSTGINNIAAANEVYGTSVSWATTDAWPTTLPGTAVGSIPNA